MKEEKLGQEPAFPLPSGMYGKKALMERQNSNGLIKIFKREYQSKNVSKALRIMLCYAFGLVGLQKKQNLWQYIKLQ